MSGNTRRDARVAAFKTIYQRARIGVSPQGEKILLREETLQSSRLDFYTELVDKTWTNLNNVDSLIQANLINWKQSRITGALNALLRLGAAELVFLRETNGKVALNEAVEICREFVDEKATKICNGTLDSIWKDVQSGKVSLG